ncbi:MAG: 50S ribosomal protein L17, partial [Proteobacteria bacterium]
IADRLVTLGKKGNLHAKRLAARQLRTREALVRLFDEIAPGYTERNGGYTRIVKLHNRKGDDAPMSLIELMPPGPPETKGRGGFAPTLKTTAVSVETKESFDQGDDDAS